MHKEVKQNDARVMREGVPVTPIDCIALALGAVQALGSVAGLVTMFEVAQLG